MTTEYPFTKSLSLLDAFQNYMKTNNAPLYEGCELTGTDLIVKTSGTLSEEQLATVTTLVTDYVEPPYYLSFSRTESLALHSHYTSDSDLVQADGRSVVQTLIFTNRNQEIEGQVLNCIKTVLEYNTPNLQNFVNTTSGSIAFEIFDITRNVQICLNELDISEIATGWNTLAQTGSTSGNTVYKSHMCGGLADKTTDYDCVYQFRLSTSHPDFNCRMNGLQYLFYNKQMSSL